MLETDVAHTKPLSRMQSLPESGGGSKVTKPIFSNSAKCYKSEMSSVLLCLKTERNGV